VLFLLKIKENNYLKRNVLGQADSMANKKSKVSGKHLTLLQSNVQFLILQAKKLHKLNAK
jgi:hypothetical protein